VWKVILCICLVFVAFCGGYYLGSRGPVERLATITAELERATTERDAILAKSAELGSALDRAVERSARAREGLDDAVRSIEAITDRSIRIIRLIEAIKGAIQDLGNDAGT